MTDQIESLILEHRKAMRAQLNRIKADIAELKGRDHIHEAYRSALHSDAIHHRLRLRAGSSVQAHVGRLRCRSERFDPVIAALPRRAG
jgi:hypothetical protein